MDTGKRKLLNTLYETHRREVYYLCNSCLMGEKNAVAAAEWVFETAFQEVLDGHLKGGDRFIDFCRKKAAHYCKKQIAKQDPKAFRTPTARNYYIRDFEDRDIPADADRIHTLLSILPQPQNFLFVMRHIGHLDEAEMADITGMKEENVKIALEAEERNLNMACNFIQDGGGNVLLPSKEALGKALEEAYNACSVPEDLDRKVGEIIDIKMLPEEKKAKRKMFTIFGGIAVAAIIAAVAALFIFGRSSDKASAGDTENSEMDREAEEDDNLYDDDDLYDDDAEKEISYADIAIEGYGTIQILLDAGAAPETVKNFIELAESGFYNGLTFHRIMEGFMMQGGDPDGNGSGGSEKTITGEFSANGFENPISHTRGVISMARAKDYNSASSQFFIVQEDSTFLDGQYAAFGYVTDGMDIVDQICKEANPTDDNGTIPAEEQPVITSVVIHGE